MNIIHVATDEKFINSAYWQFETAFPGRNRFYLLVKDPKAPLRHVTPNDRFHLVRQQVEEIKKLARSLGDAPVFCIHGLDYFRAVWLNALGHNARVVWFLWGTEVYSNFLFFKRNDLSGPLTRAADRLSLAKLLEGIKSRSRHLYFPLIKKTDSPEREMRKAMRRAQHLGILYEEEYEFIRKKVNPDLRFLRFSYYPIELMVADPEARVHDTHILIGNSSWSSNNHLEVFELLEKLPIGSRKLIVPLSYGEPGYRDQVIEAGTQVFGNAFQPLMDFMPLHEYNAYLEQCGIVIMNHYRQQALGNVLTMLWMGAKVYLNEQNTIYTFLKRIGVTVFSIEKDLRMDNKEVFAPLAQEEQEATRHILKASIGKEFLLNELRQQFQLVLDEQ